MGKVEIPLLSSDLIEVELPLHSGRYYVSLDSENLPGFTWVSNVSGTDGATYLFSPEQLRIISHSTHNREVDGKEDIFESNTPTYWDWLEIYQELLDMSLVEN
jgi:hypothetical protein